jgi:hypothetical protein
LRLSSSNLYLLYPIKKKALKNIFLTIFFIIKF